jgi:hypothetical protein
MQRRTADEHTIRKGGSTVEAASSQKSVEHELMGSRTLSSSPDTTERPWAVSGSVSQALVSAVCSQPVASQSIRPLCANSGHPATTCEWVKSIRFCRSHCRHGGQLGTTAALPLKDKGTHRSIWFSRSRGRPRPALTRRKTSIIRRQKSSPSRTRCSFGLGGDCAPPRSPVSGEAKSDKADQQHHPSRGLGNAIDVGDDEKLINLYPVGL